MIYSASPRPSAPETPLVPQKLPLILGGLGRWQALFVALVAGVVAALGFEPVGTVAGPILGFGALLLLLAAQPRGRAFGLGLAWGWGHFVTSLPWIAQAFTFQAAMPVWMGWVAVAGLALFLALYPALAAFLARRLSDRILPLSFLFAGLFTIAEILRGLLFTGFAWNPVGAAWLQLNGVAQMAALIGANGLTALTVLAGGSLAALLGARTEYARMWLVGLAPLLVVLGVLIPRIQPALPKPTGPEYLIIQTGVGIAAKYGEGGIEASLWQAIRQTQRALAKGPAPAAVIWPEAVVEYPMEEMGDVRADVTSGLPEGTLLLTGGVGVVRDAQGRITAGTNSFYALDSKSAIVARYDKAHLVPGGEYLPLRTWAEPLGLARLVPGGVDFQPGPGPQTLALPGLPKIAPNICYEIIFPGAVVDKTDRPEMIMTISNDAWFSDIGAQQHFAQARLRAIEEGLPVLRATPTGISGVIDPRGKVQISHAGPEAVSLRVQMPQPMPAPPFSRHGLLIPAIFAWILCVIGLKARGRKMGPEAG